MKRIILITGAIIACLFFACKKDNDNANKKSDRTAPLNAVWYVDSLTADDYINDVFQIEVGYHITDFSPNRFEFKSDGTMIFKDNTVNNPEENYTYLYYPDLKKITVNYSAPVGPQSYFITEMAGKRIVLTFDYTYTKNSEQRVHYKGRYVCKTK